MPRGLPLRARVRVAALATHGRRRPQAPPPPPRKNAGVPFAFFEFRKTDATSSPRSRASLSLSRSFRSIDERPLDALVLFVTLSLSLALALSLSVSLDRRRAAYHGAAVRALLGTQHYLRLTYDAAALAHAETLLVKVSQNVEEMRRLVRLSHLETTCARAARGTDRSSIGFEVGFDTELLSETLCTLAFWGDRECFGKSLETLTRIESALDVSIFHEIGLDGKRENETFSIRVDSRKHTYRVPVLSDARLCVRSGRPYAAAAAWQDAAARLAGAVPRRADSAHRGQATRAAPDALRRPVLNIL